MRLRCYVAVRSINISTLAQCYIIHICFMMAANQWLTLIYRAKSMLHCDTLRRNIGLSISPLDRSPAIRPASVQAITQAGRVDGLAHPRAAIWPANWRAKALSRKVGA